MRTLQNTTQPIIIFGLGREGQSSYRFIRHHFPEKKILLVDDRPLAELDAWWKHQQAADDQFSFSTSESLINSGKVDPKSMVIKTPGIPLQHPLLVWAKQQGAIITSQLELCGKWLIDQEKIVTIGITGTKGKSTTSALTAHLLTQTGLPVLLAGNIGTPLLSVFDQLQILKDGFERVFLVIELSAHQLAELTFSPTIAVIQDIVPEHLDYYADFNDYLQAKSTIARWQKPTDAVIFNQDFPYPTQLAQLSRGLKLPFSSDQINKEKPLLSISPLKGSHNLQNVMAAVMVARHFDLTENQIEQGLQSFQPLEHRLELVAEVAGVSYYNDSLSTVPEAASAAIQSFDPAKVILIAGGYDRHLAFASLADTIINHRVKALILFPPTGKLIWQAVMTAAETRRAPLPHHQLVTSMPAAVDAASELAQPGDVVLMSPASASFGLFTDYADRGRQFKARVAERVTHSQ